MTKNTPKREYDMKHGYKHSCTELSAKVMSITFGSITEVVHTICHAECDGMTLFIVDSSRSKTLSRKVFIEALFYGNATCR